MKINPRRKRSDSAAAAVAAAQAVALGPLDPPAHVTLRPGDRPFWDAIVTARARDTWTGPDLVTAANMARSQADIERLQSEVDAEGYVVDDKISAKAKLVETLSRRVVVLAAALHVHALSTQGRARDAGNALALERRARTEQDDDDLIPRLRAVA